MVSSDDPLQSIISVLISGRGGRIFGLNGLRDDTLLSIAALQLCRDADLDQSSALDKYDSLAPARQRLTQIFVAQFKERWDRGSRNQWGASYYPWTRSVTLDASGWDDLVFQYHMRVLTAHPDPRPLGPGLKRASGSLQVASNTLRMIEVRYSVALKTTWRLDFPVFSLVTMSDSTTGHHLQGLPQLGNASDWDKAGIRSSARATGMAAFAFRIHSLLPQWQRQWSCLIDEIEKFLNNDVSDFRRSPMHNSSPSSEVYFSLTASYHPHDDGKL